jgi:O-antigen/teichoic acid export membrane protein
VRSYFSYLGKIKFVIILVLIAVLVASAGFISNSFYNKPIFWALIAGTLYILFYGLTLLLQSALQSFNKFRAIFIGETIFQFFRIALISLAVFLSLKFSLSNEFVLFYIFLALGVSYLLVTVFLGYILIKKIKIFKEDKIELSKKQKKQTNKFLIALSASMFSGILFSYIDRIMLGHFVAAEFIGYYTIALSFVSAASVFAGFGSALFPIFSRVGKTKLEIGFRKSRNVSLIFGVISTLFILVLAAPIISIIYGGEYLAATNLLRLLSLSFFTLPLTGLYTIYFMSKNKPQIIAKFSIISTIINIALNYLFITIMLAYSDFAATFGAGIALLLSQFFYIIALEVIRKKEEKKTK